MIYRTVTVEPEIIGSVIQAQAELTDGIISVEPEFITKVRTYGGETQHTIHLEFSDSTDTDIDAYYDDSLIGTMITAYQPSTWTYNNKTVYVAELDGMEWYNATPSPETWETLFNANEQLNSETPYNGWWIEEMSDVPIPENSVWRITLNGVVYKIGRAHV